MNKSNATNLIKNVKNGLGKHSPEILTGIGIAGMITTTVLAVKATPKALELLKEAKYKKEREAFKHNCKASDASEFIQSALKPIEIVEAAWKPYIPAAVTCVASITCLIGASSVNAKRNAALATAYELSKTALTEYKEKVVEEIGEKKEKAVRKAIAKDKVEQNPVSKNEVIITGKGDVLCYDITAGQYFKSDVEKIKSAVNDLNKRMLSEMYISWNEFFSELGMKTTPMGDQLGWNLDSGLIELDFGSQLSEDGTACVTIEYLVAPRYDFSKLM